MLEPGHGYADARVALTGVGLDFQRVIVRAEVGWRPAPNVSLFGYGEASGVLSAPSWMAGVGARVTW